MSYPNVCPDCNGHFDPGHTCPPTSSGNRIRDLERQLAEAKAILSDLPDHSDVDAAVFEANALRGQLAEAQGKLDAVREWRQGLDGYPNDWAAGLIGDVKADLDRILKEEK